MTDLALERAAIAIHRVMMPGGDDWGSAGPLWKQACRDAAREAGRALAIYQPAVVRIPHLGRVNADDA